MTKVKKMIKKMCVIGDAAVGKTSLIRKFVLDRFDDNYIATIGTKTTAKALKIPVGSEVIDLQLQIWDILGQQGYTKLHESSFRGTNGVFLVADCTRKKTLHSLDKYWIPKVQHITSSIPFVILANKSDLIGDVVISREELKKLAFKYKVPFYFTSAKNGENVKLAFNKLGKRMVEQKGVEPHHPEKPTIFHPRVLFGGDKGEIARVIDRIIVDFCSEYSSLEDAMPVLRRQFELAELDINNPTLEALKKAIERLSVVEMSIKKRQDARADHDKRLKWISEIEKKMNKNADTYV
ncbi:MAG: GTP-binding protein [Thermoplasmata archaeon]|nr:MAG: GTP-binding protein [Thermoplasmata archaeon]